MAAYDERPISAYDNLSNHNSANNNSNNCSSIGIGSSNGNHVPAAAVRAGAAKQQHQAPTPTWPPMSMTPPRGPTAPITTTTTTTATTTATSTPTATMHGPPTARPRSPLYADILYKFDDSAQVQQQRPFPNQRTGENRNVSQSQVQAQSLPSPPGGAYYAMPFKAPAVAAVTASVHASNNSNNNNHTQYQQQHNNNNSQHSAAKPPTHTQNAYTDSTATGMPTHTPVLPDMAATPAAATTTTSAAPATTATAAYNGNRPLSQHSQSELNAASQNIAAVKAALNDAKSKFFGLNGYATESPETYKHIPPPIEAAHLIAAHEAVVYGQAGAARRTQPKYQNIPENSAIFRSGDQRQEHEQQPVPPALPPKPSRLVHVPEPHGAVGVGHLRNTPSPVKSPPERNTASPQRMPAYSGENPTISYQHHPQQHQQQQQHQEPMDTGGGEGPSPSSYSASYQQIPLNDIVDTSQPSQIVYMSTTVPQNIKASRIAGRHTPTRNSLRHSRMLVVNNKNYQEEMDHPNPLNFRSPNLARWLLIFQIIVGLLIVCLAVWIFFLAPSTAIQDNPYWGGLSLIMAGALGLVLIRYQRIKRHKARENCFIFLRANSYLLSLLAVVLCGVALVCAVLHYVRLTASDTHCESTNPLLEFGSCTCTFKAREEMTANMDGGNALKGINGSDTIGVSETGGNAEGGMQGYKVEYKDLSCQELRIEWSYVLILSMILNTFAVLFSALYLALLSCYKISEKGQYASVHTSTF